MPINGIPAGIGGYLSAGYRHTQTIDVSADDFEPGYLFTLHIGAPTTAGASTTVKYRTAASDEDQSVTVTAATEFKFMGEVIRLQAVRAAATGTGNTALADGVVLTVGVL